MITLNNKDRSGIKLIMTILAIYAVCFLFSCLEYFIIRTDQTFFGEAFVHKLLGTAVCFIALFALHIKPADAGFRVNRVYIKIHWGALLGISVYFLAYGVELIIIAALGKSASLHFYVTSYSVNGNVYDDVNVVFRYGNNRGKILFINKNIRFTMVAYDRPFYK